MRRRPVVDEGGGEKWLLTYADLISVLLVFFIILYAMSNVDQEKFEKLVGSLASAFQGIGSFAGTSTVQGSPGGTGVMARFTSQVEQTVTRGGVGTGGSSSSKIKKDFQYISNQIDELVTANGLEDKVSVEQTAEGIVVNLAGDLLFLTTRADLRPESYFVLDAVSDILQNLTNDVRVEGHTDSIPPQNEAFPTNWHLSGARALSVLQFLEQFGRIDRDRLHYAGWSDLRPFGPNDTLEGRLSNRRASIVILCPDESSASSARGLSAGESEPAPPAEAGRAIEPAAGLPGPTTGAGEAQSP